MSMIVHHKKYGEGIVHKINDETIEVSFSGEIKKFAYPSSIGLFLVTENEELIAMAKKATPPVEKPIEPRKPAVKESTTIIPVKPTTLLRAPVVDSRLVGERAQTIPIKSYEEMFEIVGYMATPGRISSFEAEVPKDGRDRVFEERFPNQVYRPIALGYTPSGMPNKLSPQFRINFANIRNCPEILLKNMGKGNSSCVGRINKSKFVLDMVENYGFCFGDSQNVNAIKAIAEKKGYLESFEKGFRR